MIVSKVYPEQEQLAALQAWPSDQAVVMVNIIKFKDLTAGGNESGRDAYTRYMRNVFPLLQKAGGQVVWQGAVGQTVIGDSEGQPDLVLLVEYPRALAFLEMIKSEAYLAIASDRSMALEYGGLLACQPMNG